MIHHDGSTRNKIRMVRSSRKAVALSPAASTTPRADLWSDFDSLQAIFSSLHKQSLRLQELAATRKCMASDKARSMGLEHPQQHKRCNTPQICKAQMYRDRAIIRNISNMVPPTCTAWHSPRSNRRNRLTIRSHDIPSALALLPRRSLPKSRRRKRQQHSITLQDNRFRVQQCPKWRRRTCPPNIRPRRTQQLDLRPLMQAR